MSFFGIELNVQLNRLIFDIRLHLAKNRYMPNIRTIYRSFVQYDLQVSGLIYGFYFEKALNSNGVFLKKYDLQLFEKAYNQEGKINWMRFLNHLREPMNPSRRALVQEIFDNLDIQRLGRIIIQQLMSHFNYNEIQTYRYGKKSQQQISQEFLSMINVQQGCVTRDEFIQFYDDLNINFGHNEIFFRYLSTQWFYMPGKMEEVREEEVRKHVLLLRNKLLERTQASKDELLISKLFREFDTNGSFYLNVDDVDLMLKKLGITAEPRLIEHILAKIDKNKSGYIEFDEFKMFLYHHPYQY